MALFKRDRSGEALAIAESLRSLPHGWILKCEARVLNSRAGSSKPIVSFRFAWAYPPSEPAVRAGRYRGLGLAV